MSDEITMAVSPGNKKPLCVLLQACYGIPYDGVLIHAFDEWQTSPTEDARKFTGTREQWLALAKVWNQHHKAEAK